MNKADLVDKIADATGITKTDANDALDALVDCITKTLASGGKVSLPGLGSFSTAERSARKGRNPQTGAVIDIPASRGAKFSPAKALKEAMN